MEGNEVECFKKISKAQQYYNQYIMKLTQEGQKRGLSIEAGSLIPQEHLKEFQDINKNMKQLLTADDSKEKIQQYIDQV